MAKTKTQTLAYPDFPPELPSSVGATYCDVYRSARQSMIDAAEGGAPHEVIAELAGAIALAVEENTPRASNRTKDKLWAALVAWNDSLVGDRADVRFRCERCGEYRLDAFECEGTIVKHARLIEILEGDFDRAPKAVIEPEGCQHPTFSIVCRTCHTHHHGYEPVVRDKRATGPDLFGEPKKDTKDFSVN